MSSTQQASEDTTNKKKDQEAIRIDLKRALVGGCNCCTDSTLRYVVNRVY